MPTKPSSPVLLAHCSLSDSVNLSAPRTASSLLEHVILSTHPLPDSSRHSAQDKTLGIEPSSPLCVRSNLSGPPISPCTPPISSEIVLSSFDDPPSPSGPIETYVRSTASPASSPDPLTLFSPPGLLRASSVPENPAVSSPTSSPLTPTSPLDRAIHGRNSHSPTSPHAPLVSDGSDDDELLLVQPSRPDRLGPPAPPEDPPATLLTALAEHNDGRYSLRTRNARQLKPYEYDKLMYKQQMRSNPDALVKVVSPPRARHGHRSTSTGGVQGGDPSGAEDEYNDVEGDTQMDEDARWERRMQKKAEARARSEGNVEDAMRHVERPEWLPVGLEEPLEGSSSEEDDAELDALQIQRERERKRKEKEERRKNKHARHARPFPLRRKDIQPSASSVHEQRDFSRGRSPSVVHPRRRVPTNDNSSPSLQLPEAGPSSPQDRHRSITHTSPVRNSVPTNQENDFAMWDDDYPDFGDPVPLPPTPDIGVDDGRGSEAQVPPTSSTPPDIIEIPSDSEDELDLPLPRRSRPLLSLSSSPGSGSDSGSGNSSSDESMDEKARKQMRALKRMVPQFVINRMLAKKPSAPRAREPSPSEANDGDEDGDSDERRPAPGKSFRRIRSHSTTNREIVIRGDSESSEDDVDGDAYIAPGFRSPSPNPNPNNLPHASDDEDEIRPIGHQPRPRSRSHISLSDQSDPEDAALHDVESTSEESDCPPRRRARDNREAKEGDLIDRMLSRTNHSTAGRSSRRKRAGGVGRRRHDGHRGGGGGGGSKRQRSNGGGGREGRSGGNSRSHVRGHHEQLRIVTGGVGRHSGARQTLLNFPRLPTPEKPERRQLEQTDDRSPPPHEVAFGQEAPQKSKGKKQKSKPKNTGLYVFSGDGAHLVSGRTNVAPVTVDQEFATRRGPDMRNGRPGTRRLSKSNFKPSSKGHRAPSKSGHPQTLEGYFALNNDVEELSDDSFVVRDEPVPQHSTSRQQWEIEHLRRVTADMSVHPLPAGIAFPVTTYLGQGWLYQLINILSGTHDIPPPPSRSMFDCHLHPEIPLDMFCGYLEDVYDRARNLLFEVSNPADYATCSQWQAFLHLLSQYFSWLLAKPNEDARLVLLGNVESLVQRLVGLVDEPTEILPDDEKLNPLTAQILWFLVEASCRLACDRRRRMEEPDLVLVSNCVKSLISRLWDFCFGPTAFPLELSKDGLTEDSAGQQIAELWICLLNLTCDQTFSALFLPPGSSFWSLCLQVLEVKGIHAKETDVIVQEAIWRSFFTLSAFSQFSMHGVSSLTPRLPASWQAVAAILEHAPLSSKPEDRFLSARAVHKRDLYVRVLVSRCLRLNLKWRWRLDVDDASLMFNRLLEIFKSRRFASLTDEPSDFPIFLRDHNLTLLHKNDTKDTAFSLFLKLVVRAAGQLQEQNPQPAQPTTIPPRLKKLLSMTVPVGSVPFTKASPPSARELSTLYHRFSAIAVAIYLEPTQGPIKQRLSSARKYVNFRDADSETRRACIRGAMHLGALLRHLDLPLGDLLDWLGDMTDALIEDYKVADKAANASTTLRDAVLSIQLLLGCVQRILQTPSMNPEDARDKYPDPALLQGPWVTRLFSMETNLPMRSSRESGLAGLPHTSNQIRTFVQAFLNERARVMPKPRRPLPSIVEEDSQESQFADEYEAIDITDLLEDPESLKKHTENMEKDKAVSEVINGSILPAIYRLVCKHFSDPQYQQPGELEFDQADKWIDCWVGCINVVVQNGKKDWEFYLGYGPHSWENIIDPAGQRRVGLRFMYMLLRLDPQAYTTLTSNFVNVLFEAMATRVVTLEHDFVSLLLSIDRLRHPLFQDLPVGARGEDGDYHLTKQEFTEKRLTFLERMFANLSEGLDEQANGDTTLETQNEIHVTSVMKLVEAMQDILKHLQPDTPAHAEYLTFCCTVFALLSTLPPLNNHARLTKHMSWLRGISQQ
ncbi:Mus7/MMS22 family-domain-containing protein [Trametes meyenii]|nr:Mus7/MMS22 family-domain-containing protein [Trametes meyenii]